MRPLILPDSGKVLDFNSIPISAISGFDGLVAIGANFMPETLLSAYRCGLFPWYKYKGMPYWYCPDPRMVLYSGQLHVSKSMRNVLRHNTYNITCDRAFRRTIQSCAGIKRKNEEATWIDVDFVEAYTQLHHLGYAHSFEAWNGDQLVGGLYGIGIGRVFFGESMFASQSNASKAAFIKAVQFLEFKGYALIDCQISTEHLSGFGAVPLNKLDYLTVLQELALPGPMDGRNWNDLFVQNLPS